MTIPEIIIIRANSGDYLSASKVCKQAQSFGVAVCWFARYKFQMVRFMATSGFLESVS